MLELARRGAELDAVVCLHGDLATTMPAKQGDIKAAIFVIRGSKDPVAPKADRDALEAELDGAEANRQLLDSSGRADSFSDEETDMPDFVKFDAGTGTRPIARWTISSGRVCQEAVVAVLGCLGSPHVDSRPSRGVIH